MTKMTNLPKFTLWATIFLIGLLLTSTFAQKAYAEPAVAQVVWVKGSLTAMGNDKQARPLKRGGIVYEHDTLVTDKTGSGQIVFTDSSLFALTQDSQFKIDDYKFKKDGNPSDNKYIATLAKGGFRTITGAISKGHPENYKLVTPVATIGVRGTEYRGVFRDGKLSIGIDRSAIVVTTQGGQVELTANTDQIYSEIDSALHRPVATKVQPAVLKNMPDLVPAQPTKALLTAPASTPYTKASATTGGIHGPGPGGPGPGNGNGGSGGGGSHHSSGSSSSGGTKLDSHGLATDFNVCGP